MTDEEVLGCMEVILQIRAQSFDATLGIPEDEIKSSPKKLLWWKTDLREKYMVDVIRNDDRQKLTYFIDSYMKESIKNDDRRKYNLALDHEAIYSCLAPLKDVDLSNLDRETKLIVGNLVFSAEKINEHYKPCKEIINHDPEIAWEYEKYEESRKFFKDTEIELLDILKGGDGHDELELAALQLSEKVDQCSGFLGNEQTDCPPPENPNHYQGASAPLIIEATPIVVNVQSGQSVNFRINGQPVTINIAGAAGTTFEPPPHYEQ